MIDRLPRRRPISKLDCTSNEFAISPTDPRLRRQRTLQHRCDSAAARLLGHQVLLGLALGPLPGDEKMPGEADVV